MLSVSDVNAGRGAPGNTRAQYLLTKNENPMYTIEKIACNTTVHRP